MDHDQETMLSPAQLGQRLGDVPLSTIYKWNSEGTGPRFVKIGKHVRYRPSDVAAWLENKAATGSAA